MKMKKSKLFYSGLPRRVGAMALAVSMVAGSLYLGSDVAYASASSWKQDVEAALDEMSGAMDAKDGFSDAQAALEEAYASLESSETVENLVVTEVGTNYIVLEWSGFESDSLIGYNVYWADKNEESTRFLLLDKDGNNAESEDEVTVSVESLDKGAAAVSFTVHKSTSRNYYFKVAPVTSVGVGSKTEAVMSPTAVSYHSYLEGLGRGLSAAMTDDGVYLNWRLLADEVSGSSDTGLTGVNFNVYRGTDHIATVTDSTNYLDTENKTELEADTYMLIPVDSQTGEELTDQACTAYDIFTADSGNQDAAYLDIPLQIPESATFRETYGIDKMALAGYTMTDGGYTSVDAVIAYSANDMSAADVDGDGEYEYLLQWEPSYSKDVSQQGYTGKTYIDCYELDGTLLWRLDLGINIRAGAHYTEFGAFDYDMDGKAELIVKTAPGTRMIKYKLDEKGKNVKNADGSLQKASENYVTIPQEDLDAGVTNDSSYVFSAEDYRAYLIDVFQDWGVWSRYSEKTVKDAIEGHWSGNLVELLSVSPEYSDTTFYTGEVEKSANVTFGIGSMSADQIRQYIPDYKEGDTLVNVCLRDDNGNIRYVSASAGVNPVLKTVRVEDVADYYGGYDLAGCNFDASGAGYTEKQAEVLADYFLKHYEYRMKKHNLETWEGYVITGPEYVTLFDCSTGDELDTQDWFYEREDDGLLWGDYAMNYIEPGNRVDRYNVAVAYLDGETPSCIMGRGYYTRTTMVAYNVVDKKLHVAGNIDSGWTVMTNPFNDGPHGFDGCDPVNGTLSGQGDHYIAVADVDGDGCQDIVNGGAIVSYRHGEMYLYSSGGDYLNGGTGDRWAKYGHGDAIHITDIDPDRPGLEIASCFEGGAGAPYNWAVRDAKTNTALFGAPGTTDFGRLMIGDVLTDLRGLEVDAGFDCKGNSVSLAGTSSNMNIKWSANMSTQFITGTSLPKIIGNVDGRSYTFLTATGYATNNSTKGNPGLVADLFGDYREEMILRASDSSHLRIYMNTEVSEHKNYTLMQNLQYRVGIASQNSSYNQPAYTDYYYASDTDWKYVTIPNQPAGQEPGKVEVQPAGITLNAVTRTLLEGETLQLKATVLPSSASQEVTWRTDNEKVVTVSGEGLVTAMSGGAANVTATTANGKSCSCRISVVGAYEEEGLDEFPVGRTVTYTFGDGGKIKAGTVYEEKAGYGWQQSSKISLTDGADYVAGTNYRTTGSATEAEYEYPTFVMDVPAGIYEVNIVQGTDGTEKAVNGAYVEGNMYSVRWSSEGFSTSFSEPSKDSYIWTEAGQTRKSKVETAVADGQLTIELATWLTDAGESGTTYIKEISVTRKQQITAYSDQPTLRFIGDSTLAKYPPEDGGTWTPIPERTGWGEEFTMGRFVDDETVLVNKAVAGSSLKSYLYDGYYNDFFLTSHPGDTVIIESGINDSASGRRYSDGADFEKGLRYLIESCQAFGLDVIISSGTSSSTTYTAKMEALADEFGLPYVDLLNLWNAYLNERNLGSGDVTVDGTHLNRVGGVVAAQIVANEIAGLEGRYISGHVNESVLNTAKPDAAVTGLYVKAQTENSITLAWNIAEDTLYQPDQLIQAFHVYRKEKGSSDPYELAAVQTAYVSAGMSGPQLHTTLESPAQGDYTYYVTCKGLNGEGPQSAAVDASQYNPSPEYMLLSKLEQFNTQLYDAAPYTVETYAALKTALYAAQKVLDSQDASQEDLMAALDNVNAAIDGLALNASELEKDDFQKEALQTGAWGAGGNQSGLLSCIMEEDGNRLLKLYVEAAGQRYVNKTFSDASGVKAAVEEVKFEWYPGQPDTRNCTEMEFYSSAGNRILSLKTSNNGHIGYVTGNYPSDNRYLIGDGFHEYEGSKAVDLGLTNEAWYNVKIVFRFALGTADLYIEPRDDASLKGAEVKGIEISADASTVTKMNFLLKRGRTDGDAGNDLSILWDTYLDDFAMYYTDKTSPADSPAYEEALKSYDEAIEGLNGSVLAGDQFVLAQAVKEIMSQDVGFFTEKDYQYAVTVLKDAAESAPDKVETKSVKVTGDKTSLTAGLTGTVTAVLSEGANEELVWSSSDPSVAQVAGNGREAVVTALKSGKATITAAGASSGVAGSMELNVTGEAFFFGSQVTARSAYEETTGYGFHNYTYPAAAQGWNGDVYFPRELLKTPGTAYVQSDDTAADYLAVKGQVWTEMPEGSNREEDAITYENTGSFDVDLADGDYRVSVTFCNPTKSSMDVMVKAEDIRRYDSGDHASAQIGETTVGAGQTRTVSFDLALTDGQLTLRFEQKETASSYESSAARTVYVKSVSIDRYEASEREKTTVFVMGDSTVQTYTNTDTYRTGWGQLLYTMFGSLDETKLYETAGGYAYYETEDTIVMNYARDARSAKSFLEEGRLNEVLLGVDEGDYVFLQFAHNDDNSARVNRFLAIPDYKKYLEDYNKAVEERGGTLVLVTPIVLNVWEEDGSLDHRFDDYRLAMMETAGKNDIPVLDLMGASQELLTGMGKANVDALGMYMSDSVHTRMPGAVMFTGLLSNQLYASDNSRLEALKALMNTGNPKESISIFCEEQMKPGEKSEVTVTASDEKADVTLYTSDEKVVAIEDGRLVAKSEGQAIITAGYVTGDTSSADCTAYTAYKVVTVTENTAAGADMGNADAMRAETVSGKAPVLAAANLSYGKAAVLTSGDAEASEETSQGVVHAEVLNGSEQETSSPAEVYTDTAVAGKQPSPLGEYQFDFGTKAGSAGDPFKTIGADIYDAAKGYGFVSDVNGMNTASHSDDTVIAGGDTDYDKALKMAVMDASRLESMEFAIDLPAGEYMVSVYSYDQWNSFDKGTNKVKWSYGAKFYINDCLIGTKTQKDGDVMSAAEAAMSARVVLDQDGQIVIKADNPGKLAFLSAITVSGYVDRVDDYVSQEWKDLEDAMAVLRVKTSAFADTSTPFDYDASLVNKMMAVMDAVDGVRYMKLADTAAGDAVYANGEMAAANKTLYTESSIAALEAAMASYQQAKAALDVKAELISLYDTIEYWLQGVKTEGLEEAYSLYVDFESIQTGGSAYNKDLAYLTPGWTSVGTVDGNPYLTAYSEETGYGMAAAAAGRHRNTGNTLLDDFILGGTFAMDLPAGEYKVTVYTGDLMEGCKGSSSYQFYTDYVSADAPGTLIGGSSDKVTSANASYITTDYTFTLEESAKVTMTASGHTQAMIVEQILPVEVQAYDMEELRALVADIDGAGLEETDYTISSWTAFQAAYDEAMKAIQAGASFAQQMQTIYDNLEKTYASLVFRTAVTEYAIDFGPEKEGEEAGKVWEAAPMLSAFHTMNKASVELGLGTMLYKSNTDDNGMHYGFTEEAACGYTAAGGNYFRDYVYGEGGKAYTFKADLPAAYYYVYVYTGSKEAANTTRFYFNTGEAAAETANEAAAVDEEGRTVYTQVSGAGGQFTAPACIYKVKVTESSDAMSAIEGVKMGTLSVTLFNNDPDLAQDEVTARLNGIEICFAEELSDEDVSGGDVTGGDVTGGDVTGGDVTGGDVQADKTELNKQIARAESLDEKLYTQDSYEAVADALKTARDLGGDSTASQETVDRAAETLKQAIDNLVRKMVDKTKLQSLFDRASLLKEEAYTAESFAVLKDALTGAETVLENKDASQADVDAAADRLNDAVGQLKEMPEVDRAALEAAIAEAEAVDGSRYTAASCAELLKALKEARKAMKDQSISQEELDAAAAALNQAIAALVEKPDADKTLLVDAVSSALKTDGSMYTAESYNVLQAALNNARTVLNNEEATQEEVNAALETLNSAVAGLELKEDDGQSGQDGDSSGSGGSQEEGNTDSGNKVPNDSGKKSPATYDNSPFAADSEKAVKEGVSASAALTPSAAGSRRPVIILLAIAAIAGSGILAGCRKKK